MILRPFPWHESQWQQFSRLQQQQQLPHALLLSGQKGIGKQQFTRAMAQRLLCEQPMAFACGHCKSCHLFSAESGVHPDLLVIGPEDKSTQIKIDQVRRILDFDSKTAQITARKVVIIGPAESMNLNAANALLKCLEEPSGDSILLLTTHSHHRVLPTIFSRCRHSILQGADRHQADAFLADRIADAAERKRLLYYAGGNPLAAEACYDKGGLAAFEQYIEQLTQLMAGQGSIVGFAKAIEKTDVLLWLGFLQLTLHNLLKGHFVDDDPEAPASLLALSKHEKFPLAAYGFLDAVHESVAHIQSTANPNVSLLIEALLFRWQHLALKLSR